MPDALADCDVSHDWTERGTCRACGMDATWDGASDECAARRRHVGTVTLDAWVSAAGPACWAFVAWWRARRHEETAPSYAEWSAQMRAWVELRELGWYGDARQP